MNKSESKYFNTACLMDEALLLLLTKKEFKYVTVKELCAKAGVNRSTFYLHYENMADLLNESLEYKFRELQNKYGSLSRLNVTEKTDGELLLFLPDYSIPYLEFLKEHKEVFMAALEQKEVFNVEQTFNRLYSKLFSPILERYGVPDAEKRYVLKFYVSGVHAIAIEWLSGGCKEEIPFIADLIVRCVGGRTV